jgi:hypothetical protein
VIVDSSGLKICGQGEWHSQKHGEKKGKRWKKLHIGVDDQGLIIASTISESNEQDPSQVSELLDQIDADIDRFVGDGIYDQEPVYTAVKTHSPGAQVIIPPRKDAVLTPRHQPHRRNAINTCWRLRGRVDLPGNGRRDTMIRRTPRTRLPDSSGRSAVACGRSGRSLRSGKPHWLASCSIGCRNWVGLSPIRLAKSWESGTTDSSCRFVQQRPFKRQFPPRSIADRRTPCPTAQTTVGTSRREYLLNRT